MTMRELARLANVSVSTVSKAFNNSPDINKQTKNQILELAKIHGCYGKYYKGKFNKKIIAIICHEFKSNFYTQFVERLQSIIESNNGIAIVSADNFSATRQAEFVEYYASYLKVDAIIIFGTKTPIKKGYDIPIVSISPAIAVNDSICVDYYTPLKELFELLHNCGHRNIAFIGEALTTGKQEAFEALAKEYDDINTYIIKNNYRFEQCGKQGITELLNKTDKCTAVICAYDNVAFGAIRQLKKSGYNIPNDISVVGMDNISTAEFSETSLSTIDASPNEICMLAWDLVEKKLQNKFYRSYQRIILNGKLIIRESIAKAPQ